MQLRASRTAPATARSQSGRVLHATALPRTSSVCRPSNRAAHPITPGRSRGLVSLEDSQAWPSSLLVCRATSTSTDVVRSELAALEAERETAVSTAESCAKTATKLAEMAQLLEKLALDKVQQGDETGARNALQEKASVTEAMEKNSDKADVNYKLAAVLAKKIADKQSQLLATLRPSSSDTTPPPSPSSYYSSSYSSNSASNDSSSPKWKWQQSLEEARERLKAQEAKASLDVRMAKLTAAESIAAAQQRIQSQVSQSVREAQERLRQAELESKDSLAAAQARLRVRDEEALAYVRRVMARYRSGEYVSEDELEFAFRQLEQRFLL